MLQSPAGQGSFSYKMSKYGRVVEGRCQSSHSQKIFILVIRYFCLSFLLVLSLIKKKPEQQEHPYQYKILSFILSILSKYVKCGDDNQLQWRAKLGEIWADLSAC